MDESGAADKDQDFSPLSLVCFVVCPWLFYNISETLIAIEICPIICRNSISELRFFLFQLSKVDSLMSKEKQKKIRTYGPLSAILTVRFLSLIMKYILKIPEHDWLCASKKLSLINLVI